MQFFLQRLEDELYNSDEGQALMMRRIEQMYEGIQSRFDVAQEEREELIASLDSITEPAREAVGIYLKESQEWGSPEEMIKEGDLSKAVSALEQRLERIQELQEEYPEAVSPFRDYRQYLLLRTAIVESQRGLTTEASRYYEKAKVLGFTSPERRQEALTLLLNLQRTQEYREVLQGGKIENEEEAEINLLVLEGEWEKVAARLPEEADEFRPVYLSIVAELEREDKSTVPAADLADRLDRAEDIAGKNPVRKIQIAAMTIRLLRRVVNEMLDAPSLDRSKLIDSARSRTKEALSVYDSVDPDGRLYDLPSWAQRLYRLLMEWEKAEEMENWYEEGAPRDDWDQALSEGRITQAQHLFLRAGDLLDNPAGSQEEEAISLLESAFHLAEEQELRLAIAERLINLRVQSEQTSKAKSILDRLDGVPEYRLILLRLPMVREENGVQEAINYLSERADSYPRHLYVRRVLIRYMTSRIEEVVNDPIYKDEINSLANRIRERGKELQQILPIGQHTVMVAQGLFAARHYNGVVDLLDEVVEADDPPVEAMRIRGEALRRLQRLDEAADQIATIAESTADPMYAVNAAGYWLEEDNAEQAISFLEPWLEAHPNDSLLKFNLATALIRSRSDNPKSGRRAFNLLSAVCSAEQIPNSEVQSRMARAASIAGKEEVGARYRSKGIPGPIDLQGQEDPEEIWESQNNRIVAFRFSGRGLETFVEKQREYTKKLNQLYSAELLSYGDLFRQSGRMFEYWTQWTETAWEHHKSNPEMTAIKAPWPTVMRRREEKGGLLLDITALLTIWRLGRGETLLRTLREEGMKPHIRADDLEMLRRAVVPYIDYMFDTVEPPYRQLADTLRSYDLLSEFEAEEIEHFEQLVPDCLQEALMASTPDFGLACDLDDGVFVTDRQDGLEYDAVLGDSRVMSSASLLGALVDYGSLGTPKAQSAAEQHERFRGWEEQTNREVPDQVVMSGFALVDWFESGLLTTFDNAWLQGEPGWPELHLGPYAVHHILEQDQEQRTKEQKTENVSTLYAELKELIEQDVVTVLPVENSSPRDEDDLRLPEMAPYPSKLVQIADDHGLDVWSDDRVVGYLLWSFGHPLPVPEVKQEFMQFRERHSDVNLATTEELAEMLSRNGILESKEAEELGYELVKLGYRPLNFRLALAYLFRNFAYQSGSPRYQPLFRAIKSVIVGSEEGGVGGEEIPDIDPEPLQRLMFASVLPDLIASVWRVPVSRSLEERWTLATDLIDLAIERLKELGQNLGDGMTSFWVGLLGRIVAPPEGYQSDAGESQEQTPQVVTTHLEDAVEWFTEVLVEREDSDRLRKVVRGLEDYLIDFLQSHVGLSLSDSNPLEQMVEQVDEDLPESEKRGALIAGALSSMNHFLAPLLTSELLPYVDPLFRRALGVLGRFEDALEAERYITVAGSKIDVGEGEMERHAFNTVIDALQGNRQAMQHIREDLTVAGTGFRSVSEEKRQENSDLPETVPVPFEVSLLTILLRDDLPPVPEIVDTVIIQLQLLDPSLGKDIQQLRSDLLSDDKDVRRHARVALALWLLRSPFFDLRRDLRHAIPRLQEIDTDQLEEFLAPEHGWQDGEKNPAIEVGEGREYPQSMLTELRMLYTDPELLYDSATKEVESLLEQSDNNEDDVPDTRNLVANQVRLTRDVISPFGMARSVLSLLVLSDSTEDSISFTLEDEDWELRAWIGEFVTDVLLGSSVSSAPERPERYKKIHALTLRLGANVSGSGKHLGEWEEAVDGEEELTEQWIWSTLLFSARITPFLNGRYDASEELVDVLEETICDIGIAYDEPLFVADRFNPFLLGPHLLDHEVAALLYVIEIFVRYGDGPADVLNFEKVRSMAEKWKQKKTGKAQQIYDAQKEEATDVNDLKMRFSPHDAAISLIQAIDERTE